MYTTAGVTYEVQILKQKLIRNDKNKNKNEHVCV